MTSNSNPAEADDGLVALRRQFSSALVFIAWAHLPVVILAGMVAGLPTTGPAVAVAVLAGATSLARMKDPIGLELRLVSAVAMAGLPAVLVSQFEGHPWQIDLHMYFFALLAILSAWCDWRPIFLAAAVIAVHHLALSLLLPVVVFPAGAASIGRVLVHAAVVIVETAVLIWVAEVLRASFARSATAAQAARQALRDVETAGEQARKERHEQTERRENLARAAAQFEAQAGAVLTKLNAAASDLVRVAEAMQDASAGSRAGVSGVLTTSQSSAAQVNSVASSAGGMSSAIGSAASQVERAAEIARLSLSRSEESAAVINTLAGDAQQIGQVVALISDIAAQTNLLALNATIEAARAGEAGRGFAIVAQEVKALAGQTASATDQIKDRVESVQQRVASAVQAISGIEAVVRDLNEVAGNLHHAMDEQRSTVDEIAGATQHVARDANAVLAGIEAVVRATDDVGQMAGNLAQVVESVRSEVARLEGHIGRFTQDARAA